MNVGEINYSVYHIRVNDFSIIDADKYFEKITGYEDADYYHYKLKHTELIPKSDIVEYLNRFQPVFRKPGMVYYEHRLVKKNGDVIVVFSMIKSYISSKSNQLEAEVILTDITDTGLLSSILAYEQQYVGMTEHDALTGLYNRGLFEKKVNEDLSDDDNGNCAMVIVDIDNLKAINNIFSHEAGDLVLNIIATTLLMLCRNHNIISRTSGDEFCIYIPNMTGITELKRYMNQVSELIQFTDVPGYAGVNISTVMGAAILARKDASFQRLFARTRISVEKAKSDREIKLEIYNENINYEKSKDQILLIVSNNQRKIQDIKGVFGSKYSIRAANSSEKALKLIDNYYENIAIVLSDIYAQDIDGFVVLDHMRRMDYIKRVPIIFWSKQYNEDIYKNAFSHGVIDIISEPYDYYSISSRLQNTIELYQHKNHLEEMTRRQTMRIERLNAKIIDSLGAVVEFRDIESGDHIKRVKAFTQIIAAEVMNECPEYELTQWKIKMITEASPLHDVGKIAISDKILLKPGRLTVEEFDIMKTHTTRGYDIVNQIFNDDDDEYKYYCSAIARFHHEKYDGKGYPDGISGDDIPICAQIVSIADVYDALISKRCYKDAYSISQAYNMIMNGECGVFNPKLLSCFTKVKPQLEQKARILCS